MHGTEHWTKPKRRVSWRVLAAVYALLLLASHVMYALWPTALMVAPKPEPTGIVDINGHDVAYVGWRSGEDDAPFVLMIHGSPGDATNFQALGPALAARGIDALAVDLPGFGASEATEDQSAAAMAEVCLALLASLHAAGRSCST